MYPHAVQFETRRLELEQWIQLYRDRRQARTRPRTIEPCSEQSSRRSRSCGSGSVSGQGKLAEPAT